MAQEERGEYRSIYVSMFDGRDYQLLGPSARLVLLTLRCTTGPCGISVIPALVHVLAARTGCAAAAELLQPDFAWTVPSALAELRESKEPWIEVERDVVWVVRGLEFEPNLNVGNPNHRTFVQRTIASLPRLAIRGRFRQRYARWFDGIEIPSDTHPDGIAIRTEHSTTEPNRTECLTVDAREVYGRRLVVAANRAIERRITSYKPLVTDVELETTEKWRTAGVSADVAEETIVSVIAKFKVHGRSRQPHSLAYFDTAVRKAAERSNAKKPSDSSKFRRAG